MRLVLALTALALAVAPRGAAPAILIRDVSSSCYHHDERTYEWKLEDEHWVLGDRSLSRAQVEAIRELLLESTLDRSHLLEELGVTPQSLAEHRDEILSAALKWSWRTEQPRPVEIPPKLEYLLEFEYLSEPILREALGGNWGSTAGGSFEVVFPGVPVVRAYSNGLVAHMLPWTVEAGGREWKTASLAVSRALLLLADPEGPSASLLDGTTYWSEGFWNDRDFWERWVGAPLDEALSGEEYARLPGYVQASQHFVVEDVMTGNVNMQPLSMFLEIRSRYPDLIGEVRWYNHLRDGAPTATWLHFLSTYAEALAAARKQPWLLDWKIAGPDRTIGLEIAGMQAISETDPELYIHPPWKHAGFGGEPEFELLLRREGRWCATVFLATNEPGALIATAHRLPGATEDDHWLDRLEVSYHPRTPSYARVTAAGTCEVRDVE